MTLLRDGPPTARVSVWLSPTATVRVAQRALVPMVPALEGLAQRER